MSHHVIVIAPTLAEAEAYAKSSNLITYEYRPVCVGIERAYSIMLGRRGHVIILVNCVTLPPSENYVLEKNTVIRTTF